MLCHTKSCQIWSVTLLSALHQENEKLGRTLALNDSAEWISSLFFFKRWEGKGTRTSVKQVSRLQEILCKFDLQRSCFTGCWLVILCCVVAELLSSGETTKSVKAQMLMIPIAGLYNGAQYRYATYLQNTKREWDWLPRRAFLPSQVAPTESLALLQLYLNWRRKSVVGYSFDFALTVSSSYLLLIILTLDKCSPFYLPLPPKNFKAIKCKIHLARVTVISV